MISRLYTLKRINACPNQRIQFKPTKRGLNWSKFSIQKKKKILANDFVKLRLYRKGLTLPCCFKLVKVSESPTVLRVAIGGLNDLVKERESFWELGWKRIVWLFFLSWRKEAAFTAMAIITHLTLVFFFFYPKPWKVLMWILGLSRTNKAYLGLPPKLSLVCKFCKRKRIAFYALKFTIILAKWGAKNSTKIIRIN